jgi:hypothetical protein
MPKYTRFTFVIPGFFSTIASNPASVTLIQLTRVKDLTVPSALEVTASNVSSVSLELSGDCTVISLHRDGSFEMKSQKILQTLWKAKSSLSGR